MNSIDTVFFDIGNVLLFFDFERMYNQMGDLCCLQPREIEFVLDQTQKHITYEQGGLSTEEVYHTLKQMSSKSFTQDQFMHAMSDIFTPNESIYPLVHDLKQRGFRLGLLSNTCDAHYRYIAAHYPIFTLFEIPILSYEVKARKPDHAIYQAALKAAARHPEECFYLDDIPDYVNAAKALGIHAATYRNTEQMKQHLREKKLID